MPPLSVGEIGMPWNWWTGGFSVLIFTISSPQSIREWSELLGILELPLWLLQFLSLAFLWVAFLCRLAQICGENNLTFCFYPCLKSILFFQSYDWDAIKQIPFFISPVLHLSFILAKQPQLGDIVCILHKGMSISVYLCCFQVAGTPPGRLDGVI